MLMEKEVIYVAPQVEVVEVEVEMGFALSGTGEPMNVSNGSW